MGTHNLYVVDSCRINSSAFFDRGVSLHGIRSGALHNSKRASMYRRQNYSHKLNVRDKARNHFRGRIVFLPIFINYRVDVEGMKN